MDPTSIGVRVPYSQSVHTYSGVRVYLLKKKNLCMNRPMQFKPVSLEDQLVFGFLCAYACLLVFQFFSVGTPFIPLSPV